MEIRLQSHVHVDLPRRWSDVPKMIIEIRSGTIMVKLIRISKTRYLRKNLSIKIFTPVSTILLLFALMAQLVSACTVEPASIDGSDSAIPQVTPTNGVTGPTPL